MPRATEEARLTEEPALELRQEAARAKAGRSSDDDTRQLSVRGPLQSRSKAAELALPPDEAHGRRIRARSVPRPRAGRGLRCAEATDEGGLHRRGCGRGSHRLGVRRLPDSLRASRSPFRPDPRAPGKHPPPTAPATGRAGWAGSARSAPIASCAASSTRAIFVLAAGDLVASFGFSLVFPFLTIFLDDVARGKRGGGGAGARRPTRSARSSRTRPAAGWPDPVRAEDRDDRVDHAHRRSSWRSWGRSSDLLAVGALTMVLGLVDPPFIPAARAAVADVVPEERRPRAYSLLDRCGQRRLDRRSRHRGRAGDLGYPFLFLVSGLILGRVHLHPHLRVPRDEARHRRRRTAAAGRGRVPGPGSRARRTADRSTRRRSTPGIAAVRRRAGAVPLDAADPCKTRRIFLAFLPICVIIHAVSFQWVATLPIHANRDLGVSTTTWGLLFALNGILIVFFQLRIDERDRAPAEAAGDGVGLLAYGLAYLVIAPVADPDGAVAAPRAVVILVTVGEMLVYPLRGLVRGRPVPGGRARTVPGASLEPRSAWGRPSGRPSAARCSTSSRGAAPGSPSPAAAAVAAGGLWALGGPVAAGWSGRRPDRRRARRATSRPA